MNSNSEPTFDPKPSSTAKIEKLKYEKNDNQGVTMIVLLPDGKLINLNLVCFTDTRSFKEPVRFSMVNGESVFCEMTEDQYQSMLLSLVHNEPLHKVLPIKEKVQKTKIDFRDFPSVLEGENSPV